MDSSFHFTWRHGRVLALNTVLLFCSCSKAVLEAESPTRVVCPEQNKELAP